MTLRERFLGLPVAESLAARASGGPDEPFLLCGDRRLTYGEVHARAGSLAAALHGLGIGAGDRIAINLPTGPEFVITIFAAARLGAVVVPLNPRYTTTELQYMLRHSEAAAVVTIEEMEDVDFLERFEGILGSLPDLHYLVAVGEADLWYDDRVFQFDELVSSGEGREAPKPEIDPAEDAFAIVYTSGTMGKPKGVVLSHDNLTAPAVHAAEILELVPEDVVAGVTCLFNVFGLGPGVLGTVVGGASLVLHESDSADELVRTLERYPVTVHHGVPTGFITEMRALEGRNGDLASIRTGIVAGAPVPEGLAARIRDDLVPGIRIGYGLTEAGSLVTLTRAQDPPGKKVHTVGRPLPEVEIRVFDVDGSLLPVESIGEIAVRGPGVMRGYYRQPGETSRSITEDGFFLTGDLGMLDDEGYLHIVGRRKEMVIRGGYNVYPREVEDRLHAHPAVQDVAVVGLPHEILGEVACACIVPVEGAIVTGEEIREFCREVMADYKVPDLVRFLDVFPMTGSGKVRRVELARMISAEERTRHSV